jgi:hypothetical protein
MVMAVELFARGVAVAITMASFLAGGRDMAGSDFLKE